MSEQRVTAVRIPQALKRCEQRCGSLCEKLRHRFHGEEEHKMENVFCSDHTSCNIRICNNNKSFFLKSAIRKEEKS